MSIELKIKSKHLAFEPAIIRKEELKILKHIKHLKKFHQINDEFGDIIWPFRSKFINLYNHRKFDVRNEARATYIARAYLKGLPYKSVENKRKNETLFQTHILPRVFSMVAKYGSVKIKRYWTDGKYEHRPEEKKLLMDAIVEWSKLV